MRKKKEIEGRIKACLGHYQYGLWAEEFSWRDELMEDIFNDIPLKIDRGAQESCPSGLRLPEDYSGCVQLAYELAWVLDIDISKKVDRIHKELEKYKEQPKVKKAVRKWMEENTEVYI